MRSIGSLPERQQADRFAAYLDSQDIRANVEADGDKWEIWVVDEDHVAAAKSHLAEYLQAPDNPRYAEAIKNNKRHKTRQLEAALERRRVEITSRKMPWERGIPLTTALILASVFVTLMSQFGDEDIRFTRDVMMSDRKELARRVEETPISVQVESLVRGWNAIPEIRHGQVWRVFTPMFLHFDPLHLLFNMLWLVRLGSQIERVKGTRYLFWLVMFVQAVGAFAQLYVTHPFFGGMSGVVFGLFGFIWLRTRLVPEDGFHIEPSTVFLMLAWALICTTPAVGKVANAAHFGGLAAGAIVGAWPVMSLRNPR